MQSRYCCHHCTGEERAYVVVQGQLLTNKIVELATRYVWDQSLCFTIPYPYFTNCLTLNNRIFIGLLKNFNQLFMKGIWFILNLIFAEQLRGPSSHSVLCNFPETRTLLHSPNHSKSSSFFPHNTNHNFNINNKILFLWLLHCNVLQNKQICFSNLAWKISTQFCGHVFLVWCTFNLQKNISMCLFCCNLSSLHSVLQGWR